MYYIYHIEGVKIGCTSDIKARMKQQSFNKYEILEEHSDVYLASDREIELQKKYGYVVDNLPYWKSRESRLNNCSKESKVKGGKIGGKISGPTNGKKLVDSGRWAEVQKIGRSVGSKIVGRNNVISGHIKRIQELAVEKTSKKIIAINLLDNSTKTFNSISQASRELNISTGMISLVLRGKNKSKGYKFELYEKN